MKRLLYILIFFSCLNLKTYAQSWSNVGLGMNLTVEAIVADTASGVLYAGGLFTQANLLPASGIAKWDGTFWTPLNQGIINGSKVSALIFFNGDLIAGGTFTNIDGVLSNNVAKWDGANWSPLGSGLEYTGATSVGCFAVFNNELYSGGNFTSSDTTTVNYIAKWDGTNWLPLGTGTNGTVKTLCVYNGELYAGGNFTNAGGQTVSNIAKWDGSNWSDVSGGVEYTGATSVGIMKVYNNTLHVGGTFQAVGLTAIPVKNLAKWDGVNWTDVGGGVDYTGATSVGINSMKIFNSELVIGGSFDTVALMNTSNIVKWDGANWTNLGTGIDGTVLAIESLGDTLYAGGNFLTAGNTTTPFIAQWMPAPNNVNNESEYNSAKDLFNLYPNPVNDLLWVSSSNYQNSKSPEINFVLLDVLGKEILRVKDIKNEISFSGNKIPSGIYFYRITDNCGNIAQQGKLIFK